MTYGASGNFGCVFDHSAIGISITELDGDVRANAAFSEMLGYTPAEFGGRKWQDLTVPEDRQASQRAIDLLLSGERDSARLVKRYLHKDGSVVWCDITTVLRRDPQGRPLHFLTFASDITERKRAEKKLSESEERFRDFFENATVGIYRTTPDGRVLMVNPALLGMMGCSSFEELAARNLEENGFEPDYPRRDFKRRLESDGRVVGLVSAWKRRDGSTLFVRESARAVRDGDSGILYYEGTVEDITELVSAQRSLQSLSARQQALLAAIPEIVMEVDSARRYRWANPAGLDFFGDDVIGKEAADFFEGEQDTYATTQPVFSGEESTLYVESWQRRRDGQSRLLAWWCRTLRDADGLVTGAISTARDITEQRRAERELQLSEAFLSTVIEHSPVATWISDDKGTLIKLNRACRELLKISGGEVVGKYNVLQDNVVEEQGAMPSVRRVFNERQAVRFSLRYDSAQLKGLALARKVAVVLDVTMSPILDTNGRLTNVVVQHIDVTDRVRAEERLRESENRYRIVADNTYDWEYWLSPEGRFLYSSPSCQRISGHAANEFVRDPGLLDRLIHPDDRERFGHVQQQVMQARTPGEVEFCLLRPDGDVRYIYHVCQPAFDEQGRFLGLRASNRDITDRRRAEEALRESEERFSTIFKASPVGTCITRLADNTMVDVNHAFLSLFGYSRNEVIGHTARELNMWAQPEVRDAVIDSLGLNGKVAEREFKIRTKAGAIMDALISSEVIDLGGERYMVSLLRDITERKRAAAQVRAALEEKEVLLREVHHRVKNNLQAMISLIDMRLSKATAGGCADFLKELKEHARTMSLVYEQLYQSENLARVDMAPYLRKIVTNIVEAFGAERTIEALIDVPSIFLDATQAMPCGLIVNELVTNALKYAFPPDFTGRPALRVALTLRDKQVTLAIGDNGVGLPPGLERQAGRTSGLRLVKLWATHQLGGRLEMASGAETSYAITFPIQNERPV